MRFLAALSVSVTIIIAALGCGSTCKCDGDSCSNCSGGGTTTAPQGDGGEAGDAALTDAAPD